MTHRSYKDAGGSVGIAIYDDRVEIENPGSFPPNWNLEKMMAEHESKPQNPLIATVLYKRKVLESWGRGIGLMISECRREGLPEPIYKTDADSVRLIFRYESINHPSITQVPPKHHPSTTQVANLIAAIGDGIYSVTEIMEKLQLNNRRYFTKEYLKIAVMEGGCRTTLSGPAETSQAEIPAYRKGKEYAETITDVWRICVKSK